MKSKIEAILFAKNKGISEKEISKLTNLSTKEVIRILNLLKKEYEDDNKGIKLTCENGIWKMQVKEEHLDTVKSLIPSEFPKSLLKTLAVIAWKSPIKQSDVIKIRGNKAYKEIEKLIKEGFIEPKKWRNTRKLNITKKFKDYFGVEEEKLKEIIKEYTKN